MGGAATHPQLLPHCHQTDSSSHHHHPHNADRRPAAGRSNHFRVGSIVEVRPKEVGFKDTFFSATVISPPKGFGKRGSRKRLKKIRVEYHELLENNGSGEKLREYVDLSCLRPAPPQEIVEGFEPDDDVDAYYQEGWWIGIVKRVVEGGERKYVVTFKDPQDEQELGFSALRVHWDWINGSWVRPEKKSIAGLMFDVGRKVEVSFDREDGQEAWFPATIQGDLGNGAYLIEYSRKNTDNQVQTLQATVDSLHLRPWPPLLKDKNFILLEKVDAFFDSGYWSGLIKQVLENSRYLVFFKQMNEVKEFNQSELRPHMDWNDGRWFTSSQDVSIPSSEGGKHEGPARENPSASSVPTVPVNNLGGGQGTLDEKTSSSLTSRNDHFEQLTPDFPRTSHVRSLTKRKQRLSDSRTALSPSLKKLKEGIVLGANQQETPDTSIKEMLSDSVSSVSGNNVETTGKPSVTGNHSSENPSWGKRTRRKQRNVGGKINSTSSYMKNSSAQMRQVENPEYDAGGKEPDVVDNTAEDVRNEHIKKGIELPIIIGLPCAEMVNSGFGKSRGKRNHVQSSPCAEMVNSGVGKSRGKRNRGSNNKEIMNIIGEEERQLHDSTIQTIEDSKLTDIVEFSERKRRGRPRKILSESIQTPVTDDLNNKDDDPRKTTELGEAIGIETPSLNQEKMTLNKDKPVTARSVSKDRKGTVTKRTSPRKHVEKVVKVLIKRQENSVLKKGRRRSTVLQDSVDASGGKSADDNSTLKVNIVCEAPSNEFENQPLSKWIEGMHSPSPVDGPSAVSKENGEKQRDGVVIEEVNEKHQESVIQMPALVDKFSVVPWEPQQSLPFVKTKSDLWKAIESSDIFRRIPQNPHFQPLEHENESLREGKAFGYMLTFSSLVEKTSKLQFDDPKSVIDEILQTLAELERHGFNVRAVQDRMAELLVMKDKEEKLIVEVSGLNNTILEHHHEKDKIDEEIEKINEEIQKLQEKLSVVESAKGKEEHEIASLGAKVKETEEGIKNVRREFEGIVSSML